MLCSIYVATRPLPFSKVRECAGVSHPRRPARGARIYIYTLWEWKTGSIGELRAQKVLGFFQCKIVVVVLDFWYQILLGIISTWDKEHFQPHFFFFSHSTCTCIHDYLISVPTSLLAQYPAYEICQQ